MNMRSDKQMRVIDMHIHVGRLEHWNPEIHKLFATLNPIIYERFNDIMQPRNIVSMLDNNSVDCAVVLAEYSPKVTGIVTNEFIARFCEKHPNRLIPFCSVNPVDDPDPAKTLERAIKKLGMRGLKLYPTYQHFYPNAYLDHPQMKRLRQLYERAESLNIPVMFHTGTSIFPGARLKYGNPLYLDDIATDFPNMPIIAAHGGRGPWFQTAFYLTRIHPNFYLEISGLPPKNLLSYFPQLETISKKTLFGSDWPGVPHIDRNIQEIRKLAISDNAKNQILGENAAKLLGL